MTKLGARRKLAHAENHIIRTIWLAHSEEVGKPCDHWEEFVLGEENRTHYLFGCPDCRSHTSGERCQDCQALLSALVIVHHLRFKLEYEGISPLEGLPEAPA